VLCRGIKGQRERKGGGRGEGEKVHAVVTGH
jgi:hypothetical protein